MSSIRILSSDAFWRGSCGSLCISYFGIFFEQCSAHGRSIPTSLGCSCYHTFYGNAIAPRWSFQPGRSPPPAPDSARPSGHTRQVLFAVPPPNCPTCVVVSRSPVAASGPSCSLMSLPEPPVYHMCPHPSAVAVFGTTVDERHAFDLQAVPCGCCRNGGETMAAPEVAISRLQNWHNTFLAVMDEPEEKRIISFLFC